MMNMESGLDKHTKVEGTEQYITGVEEAVESARFNGDTALLARAVNEARNNKVPEQDILEAVGEFPEDSVTSILEGGGDSPRTRFSMAKRFFLEKKLSTEDKLNNLPAVQEYAKDDVLSYKYFEDGTLRHLRSAWEFWSKQGVLTMQGDIKTKLRNSAEDTLEKFFSFERRFSYRSLKELLVEMSAYTAEEMAELDNKIKGMYY